MTAGVVVCQSLIDEARTMRLRDPHRAREIAEQALAQADALAMPGLQAAAHAVLASAWDALENLANAFEHCHRAIEMAHATGDKRVQGHAHRTLGSIFHRTGDYAEALEHFDHCIELAREAGDTQDELSGLGNSAGAEASMGNFERALELLGRAKALREAQGIPTPSAVLNNEANIRYQRVITTPTLEAAFRQAELTHSLALAERAVAQGKRDSQGVVHATAMLTMADIHLAAGHPADAIAIAQAGGETAATLKLQYLTSYARLVHGEAQLAMSAYADAIDTLTHAQQHLEAPLMPDIDARIKRAMSECFERTGRHEEALRALKSAEEVESLTRREASHRRQRTIDARRAALQVEAQRRRALERVKSLEMEIAHATRLSLMGEMAAGVVHELHQPLSAVRNLCEASRRALLAPTPHIDAAAHNLDSALRALESGVAFLGKLKGFAAKRPPELQRVNIADVVDDSLHLLKSDPRARAVHWHAPGARHALHVHADRILLMQVLVNVLRNALEAVDTLPDARIDLRALPQSTREIVLSIEDNGPGFAEHQLANGPQPFTSTKPNGLGLGLQLCLRIVSSLGGRLSWANRPEGGAVVSVWLPIAEGAHGKD